MLLLSTDWSLFLDRLHAYIPNLKAFGLDTAII